MVEEKAEFKGQLVFHWPVSSEQDDQLLLAIEDTITKGLGPIGMVDGHDIGRGKMNVFVHTNNPQRALARTISLIQGNYDLSQMAVGYRKFVEDEHRLMYPPDLEWFRVS